MGPEGGLLVGSVTLVLEHYRWVLSATLPGGSSGSRRGFGTA
jgi:hypothetical protein